jgi:hypothetical protein
MGDVIDDGVRAELEDAIKRFTRLGEKRKAR